MRVNNQAVEIRELTCNQRQLRGSLSRLKSDFNDSRINEKAAIDLNTCRPIPNLSEVATEITQCIIRRQNLIVSGITEINIDNLERRINYDMATLQNIISELGFPTSAVTSARRIGKIQNGTPRLLCVECSSEDVRSKILRSSGKLRSTQYSTVYINPDLTYQERQENKKLITLLKERRSVGEDVVIHQGQVITREKMPQIFLKSS